MPSAADEGGKVGSLDEKQQPIFSIFFLESETMGRGFKVDAQ